MSADQHAPPQPSATGASRREQYTLQTRAVHAGEEPRVNGSAVTPIFQSATFLFEGESTYDSVRYTRCNNNPSQVTLGAKIASLESAQAAVPTASGMAAISTALLTFLKSGDHLLVQSNLYGGTHSLVHGELKDMGIQVTTFDTSGPVSVWEKLVQPNTKVIYVETISNPLTSVPDLPAVVAFAKIHKLVSIIDNTFAGPVNFRPLEHGFDVVCESCTKSMNGHSDVIAGCVAGSSERVLQVTRRLNHLGGTLDPHACFLLQRGLKTLVLRVRQQNANALALAQALEQHPGVSRVHYPGLASHSKHQLAARLFDRGGAGGVFAFEVNGGVDVAELMLQRLTLGLVAPSLGGVETLVTRPATTTHVGLTAQEREAIGVSDGLIRVAVGIEDTQDLLDDFISALDLALASMTSDQETPSAQTTK